MVVHQTQFFAIDDDLDFALATMLLDAMSTSGHALDRGASVTSDIGSLYIAGAGPVGLGALVMSKLRYGPDFAVYISDISPWRLRLAESLGAIPVQPSRVQTIPRVDAALDASGRHSARLAALERLRSRGVLVCVGHGERIDVDVPSQLIAPEAAILGSEYFPFSQLRESDDLLRANREYVGRLITHRCDLADLSEAFDTFLEGKTGKGRGDPESRSRE